jgi:membrane fusion protein (multidrug efflux system)
METPPQARTKGPQRDTSKPDGEKKSESSADQKRTARVLKTAVGVVVALVAAAASSVYYTRFIAPFESTDNAFIEAHVTPIAPQVAGRVARLCIQDNQEVNRGDVLLEIDPRDYEAKLAQAQASLAAANSRLGQASAQLAVDLAKAEQEKASSTAAEAEAGRTQAELKRYQSVESRAVSRSQVDVAETQARSAAAQADVARNKIRAAQAQVEFSKASIQAAAADIEQSQAAIRQAELNLSYTKITASEAGRVTRRTVEQGAYVQPGQALMAIVPHQLWVVANFKETQLALMRVGQPVEIKVDAYPGLKFNGRVDSIQTGAGARFSMFPPENATGNYIKVVQRVPVKIVFDAPPDTQLSLGPGVSVEPKVRVK